MLSEGGPCFQKHPSHQANLHGEARPDALEHGDPGRKNVLVGQRTSVGGSSFPLGHTPDTRLCGDSHSSLSAAAPQNPISILCGTTLLPDVAPHPPSGALSKGKGRWSTEPPKLNKDETTSDPGVWKPRVSTVTPELGTEQTRVARLAARWQQSPTA